MRGEFDWVDDAACVACPELPWTRDLVDNEGWEHLAMFEVCEHCPVFEVCHRTARRLDVTGGWWAGADRDPHARHTARNSPTRAACHPLGREYIDQYLRRLA